MSVSLKNEQGFYFMQLKRSKMTNLAESKALMLISGQCVMARLSVSLRNEQGFYFVQLKR